MKLFILLLLTSLSAALYVGPSQAKGSWGGFVSASYIDVSANNYYGYNSGDSGPLYEAGLRGFWQLNPSWSLSGLIIGRDNGDWFESGLELDYLSLNYQIAVHQDWELSIKLGRFKLANGIYGATQDVPFTRPSIVLPLSIYPHILKEQSLRADGIRIDLDHFTTNGQQYSFAASIGKEKFDESFTRRFLGQDQNGKFESKWNTSLHFAARPNSDWYAALEYRRLEMYLNNAIDLAGPLSPVALPFDFTIDTEQYIASLQYSQQHYELTAEFTMRRGGTSAEGKNQFAKPLEGNFDGSIDMNAYYLQAVYLINQQWNLLARYDNSHFIDNDIEPNLRNLEDITIGFTWNFHRNFQLKLEHHWFIGTSMIPPVRDLNLSRTNNPERYWRLFAAQLSYRF
ncbi:hypothetical protein [Agarivorans gilvus]|uniref:Porin n=1 Tax=Agarivorans gilvus TaxID=680279 RepID=A0ABQ1I4A7_9ALTE|nr:hypothetical protein [Agarivorans gilvus]GGB09907.1 hypothetical protein GCM10007414_24100 [Agarivorans gilvus]